jgi:hypothetical protein
LTLLLLACAAPEGTASAAHLEFLSPRDGDSVPAGVVDVSLLVENFVLVAPKENMGTPVGFLVVSVDDEAPWVAHDTVFALSLETPGAVTLSAALIYADGAPLDPVAEAQVTIDLTP